MSTQPALSAPAQGRLLDPCTTLATDPRLHPAIRQTLLKFGPPATLNAPLPPAQFLNGTASKEELSESLRIEDEGLRAFTNAVVDSYPLPENDVKVVHEKKEIPGPDGNTISLLIYRPATADEADPLPSLIYIHGGAMIYMDLTLKLSLTWMESLAARANVVVIGVDFRNGWTVKGFNPFPAGLNDCATAVQWIHAHKSELNISKIIVQGESGGANLSIATALKANREGWINKIDGVYAEAPYISGAYHWSAEEKLKAGLASLLECDGYGFSVAGMGIKAAVYESGGFEHPHSTNPLAWPYHASKEDLTGLPPFVLSIDEVDPLKDEGIAFYRKLLDAGVKARAVVKLGIPHGGAHYGAIVLEEYYGLIADIKSFLYAL